MNAAARMDRLERTARLFGVSLRRVLGSPSAREFDSAEGRTVRYRPRGSGTLRIEVLINGTVEYEFTAPDSHVERVLAR